MLTNIVWKFNTCESPHFGLKKCERWVQSCKGGMIAGLAYRSITDESLSKICQVE